MDSAGSSEPVKPGVSLRCFQFQIPLLRSCLVPSQVSPFFPGVPVCPPHSYFVVSGQQQPWICSGLALIMSASQAAEEWLMPLSKIIYLAPRVQLGGRFCGQRGTGGAVQAEQGHEQTPPAPRAASPGQPDPAHQEPSLSHHYSLVSKGTEPGCQPPRQ